MARRAPRLATAAVGLLVALLAADGAPPARALAPAQEKAPGPWNPPPNPGPCPNDPDAPLTDRVNKAIDLGVTWLKAKAPKSGSWGQLDADLNYLGGRDVYLYPAGITALATYTLLKCGVPPDDPAVARSFHWLRKQQETPGTSYEISMLVLAIEAKSNPRKRGAARAPGPAKGARGSPAVRLPPADAEWMKKLLAQLLRRRDKRPGWRYNGAVPGATGPIDSDADIGGDLDMSSTQLGMLAVAAGERCGFPQPDALYLDTAKWVLDQQAQDGPTVPRPGTPEGSSAVGDRARGWTYLPRGASKEAGAFTGSMTACGMANLSIAGAVLAERKNAAWTGGLADRAERAWWDGSAWFATNWSVARNPNGSSCFYYLYCLERAGDLRGVNLIGGHDWYSEGAQYLVDAQYPDGSWWGLGENMPADLLGTCFALLFLDRASRAVASGD